MIGEVLPLMLNKGMQNPSSDIRKIRCVLLEELAGETIFRAFRIFSIIYYGMWQCLYTIFNPRHACAARLQ